MALPDSPLSSVHLRKRPKRFHSLLGLHVAEFDALFDKVYKAELARQYKNHGLWTAERVERLVARCVRIGDVRRDHVVARRLVPQHLLQHLRQRILDQSHL